MTRHGPWEQNMIIVFTPMLTLQQGPDYQSEGPSDPPEGRLQASRLAAWERSPHHSVNPISSSETPPCASPHNNLHGFFVATTQELPTSQK
jgi:hypothetical protein